MFVDHLGDCISQQNHILIERFDLTLQFDSVDQVNRNRYVLSTQGVEKGVLKQLAFIAHDILRVQRVDKDMTIAQG